MLMVILMFDADGIFFSERTSTCHARHVFLFLISRPRVILTASCSTHDFLQAATQREYDLRILITFLPTFTTSFLHFTYLLLQPPLHSQITFTNTKPP